MNRKRHFLKLEKIYALYDKIISPYHLSCRKHCMLCCTRNVTLTTLEGARLFEHMETINQTSLIERVKDGISKNRFVPKATTNQIADYCIGGVELPEEEIDPAWGVCPLLEGDICPVYNARPFGCRCLVSEHDCGKKGFAGIDPYILTINDIFLQHIEHLDQQGMTGNLSDVLLFIESKTQNSPCPPEVSTPDKLIRNHPLRALMVPPEYRKRVRPVLDSLQRILT